MLSRLCSASFQNTCRDVLRLFAIQPAQTFMARRKLLQKSAEEAAGGNVTVRRSSRIQVAAVLAAEEHAVLPRHQQGRGGLLAAAPAKRRSKLAAAKAEPAAHPAAHAAGEPIIAAEVAIAGKANGASKAEAKRSRKRAAQSKEPGATAAPRLPNRKRRATQAAAAAMPAEPGAEPARLAAKQTRPSCKQDLAARPASARKAAAPQHPADAPTAEEAPDPPTDDLTPPVMQPGKRPRRSRKLPKEPPPPPDPLLLYRNRPAVRKLVGCHVSMSGGIERAIINAANVGCNAFALDTRSKRQWESKPLDPDRADAFKAACELFGFDPARHCLPHGSYLINLASPVQELQEKSFAAFLDELQRCEALGIAHYNWHPGAYTSSSLEEGITRIADAVNRAHAATSFVVTVLENTAGGGSSIGWQMRHLRAIIDKVDNKARVGVCLDTCHLFAAGYDVSTPEGWQEVLAEFNSAVGMQYLKALHVNDSKAALGSKRDRHENIGQGQIGMPCFEWLMKCPQLDGIPLIMETPVQCHGPAIDYKTSLLHGVVVHKGPPESETGIHTDKRDIALLNSLAKE